MKRISSIIISLLLTSHIYAGQKLVICLIGPPASGKGTQGAMLEKEYEIPSISAGDAFRAELRNNTHLGQMIRHHDANHPNCYTPDEVALGIMVKRLLQPDCGQGYILDGYPRTSGQADFVTGMLRQGATFIAVVLDLDDSQIRSRVKHRYICPQCGEQYRMHEGAKQDMDCPECKVKVERRKEDTSERDIDNRIELYRQSIADIEKILGHQCFHVGQQTGDTPADVFAKVNKAIQAALGKDIILSDRQIFKAKPKIEVSCAIIRKGNRVLLLKRSKEEDQSHTWCIPGGKKDDDETPLETVKRELEEELGEEVSQELSFPEKPLFTTCAWFGKYYYWLHIFEVDGDIEVENIKLRPAEHSAAEFFAPASLETLPLILGQREILQRYFADHE